MLQKLQRAGMLGAVLTMGALLSNGAQAALSPLSFGVTGGVSLNKPSTAVATAYKLGYFGGVTLDIGAGPIGVMADVLYSLRKYETDTTPTVATDMTRIEIPVYARFAVAPMFKLLAGGYFATRLGNASVDSVDDLSDTFESADYGLSGGVGFMVPGPVSLMLTARYMYGLTDMDSGPVAELKHRSFDIGASLMF